jgi:transposase, IS5 family
MSFLVSEARQRLGQSELVRLCHVIDWQGLGEKMGDLGRSGYGPKAYDPIKMLKALILQAWHSLSDPGLEEALRVRLDFMIITELTDVPDETTICRFRNRLVQQGLMTTLLSEVNDQLMNKGLKVRESKGAIVDATIIQSACRPRKTMETEIASTDHEASPTVYTTTTQEELSKDPDATWVKKGKHSHFGYKGFAIADQEDGYIETVHVTPAHVSETKELKEFLPHTGQKRRMLGDKGYPSAANQDLLHERGWKNGLMEKARRGKPLSTAQKAWNRLISKTRYKIEQAFGTLKRRFQMGRASYCGVAHVHGQMIMKAIAFNLLKALNKLKKGTNPLGLCPK